METRLIPKIGFGTWGISKKEVGTALRAALDAGYRHLDLAFIYNNEEEIGTVLKEWMNETKTPRSSIFVTSKLWNTDHRPDRVENAIRACLNRLKLEYLDLFLVHWPYAFVPNDDPFQNPGVVEDVKLEDTWKAMENVCSLKLTRFIGVSNFCEKKVDLILNSATIMPFMNQIEVHPFLQQRNLSLYCEKKGIQITAYSPLGSQKSKLHENEIIKKIAAKHNATTAQVLISWNLSFGNFVIPKSSNPERIKQNLKTLILTNEEINQINQLEKGERVCDPKKFWNLSFD